MRVIFLDCDGVLNSHTFFSTSTEDDSIDGLNFGEAQLDPHALSLLDSLVDATDASIVIASSWRHIWPWQDIADMFRNRGFKNTDKIIGQTDTSTTDNRGDEIQAWLDTGRERQVVEGDQHDPVTSYVIIDDTDEFTHAQRPNFVRTNPKVGITGADVQRAVQILSKG